MIAWSRFESPFGDGVVVCRDGAIARVLLPRPETSGEELAASASLNPDAEATTGSPARYARELARYFDGRGEPADLLDSILWPEVRPFTRTIMEACARIPRGGAVTYGELARDAGFRDWRHRGRPVGQVMARNPLPLIVPCHRVLSSGRRVGNYGGGAEMKRWLLTREGAGFRG